MSELRVWIGKKVADNQMFVDKQIDDQNMCRLIDLFVDFVEENNIAFKNVEPIIEENDNIIAENDKLKKLNVELLESLLNLVLCPAFNSKVFASDETSHTAWTVARYVIDKAREEEQHA